MTSTRRGPGRRRTTPTAGVRSRSDRGLSESTQWALLAPVLLLVVLGIVQAALVMHGRTVAANAALGGAETQALAGAGAGQGSAVAREIAERGGLLDVQVSLDATGGVARVVVSGRVDSFVPLAPGRVQAVAELPAEEPR